MRGMRRVRTGASRRLQQAAGGSVALHNPSRGMAQAQHATLPGPGASSMTTETSNARGEAEYEYEVWQGDALQAGGSTTDYASAKSEAGHYAMIYAPDGPVEVRIYEKRLLTDRSEEHTSELQSRENLVCRLLLEKKKRDA